MCKTNLSIEEKLILDKRKKKLHFGIALIVFALLFFLFGIVEVDIYKDLRDHGAKVQAVVDDVGIGFTGGSSPSQSYWVSCCFLINGNKFYHTETFDKATWKKFHKGNKIEVIYLPSDPEIACFSISLKDPTDLWIVTSLGTIPFLIGVYIIFTEV